MRQRVNYITGTIYLFSVAAVITCLYYVTLYRRTKLELPCSVLMQFISGFSPQRNRFVLRIFSVVFVVDKLAIE